MTATIHYHDIGDYLDRETKLTKLKEFKNIENVDWQIITPNAKFDWVNQRNDDFDSFLLLGDKKGNEITIFDVISNGLGTSRDSWSYNFSENKLAKNMKRTIDFYNRLVEEYLNHTETWKENAKSVEDFIDYDSTKISWSSSLINYFTRSIKTVFSHKKIVPAMYRPFCKSHVYFDNYWIHRVSQMPKIFPNPDAENIVIGIEAPGAKKGFTTLVIKTLCDLHLFESSQCFPYYVYELIDETKKTLLQSNQSGIIRRENITDESLQKFREHYNDNTITKWDIFYYVYGVLNSREYQESFSSELKKQLPRIPFANDFRGFSKAGKQLADLHLNYETLKKYPLKEKINGTNYHVTQIKFPNKTDKSKIIYNSTLTLENIPPETYQYIVNGKSALEWIMDRYKISTHKESQITNDPNDWCKEHNDPEYIVNLIKRIVTLSIESVKIIDSLPPIDILYRMKKLEDLSDGWLDGEGKALSKTGIQWFKDQFNQFFKNAPTPKIYPTPEGGLSLEWQINRHDISLEINLEDHTAYWHSLNLDKKQSKDKDLELNKSDQWQWIIEQL
jgi:predicted helicase